MRHQALHFLSFGRVWQCESSLTYAIIMKLHNSQWSRDVQGTGSWDVSEPWTSFDIALCRRVCRGQLSVYGLFPASQHTLTYDLNMPHLYYKFSFAYASVIGNRDRTWL